jgi:hypothetical protein
MSGQARLSTVGASWVALLLPDSEGAGMEEMRVLAEAQGYFTRRDVLAAGHDDRTIARALRARLWVRIRHGYYTFTDLWVSADLQTQHRVQSHAALHKLGDRVALSHVSAALEHQLLVWDVDLTLVHVTRLDGGPGRIEAGIHFHEGFCTEDEVEEIDGRLVVNRTRAALETCTGISTEHALVVLDSLLHHGCSKEALAAQHELMRHWPGMQHVQIAVGMADGRAESVGESRIRWLCRVHHLPRPDLQYDVFDHRGVLVGTTDFDWKELGLLGEFDGKVKYGRLLRDGERPEDAVFREKVREDAIREASECAMIRFIWRDLYVARETAERVRRMLRRKAA